ncbi:YihY/virulence factor BrkB family protein [Pseudarthrobacter sp. J75]|uniref:YihY/virulence factor BrkB family protein n=1 Tax=unclassified Pseudarthrobacter TaxID=2647000 RepID=UPI002E8149D7|nr:MULTISPECIES: YihY/virulence factor BrkB family protein [unclassified Pseudarthrobacter]MEE2521569.1 YihY/virulence factor BrkB family protein [Pseudarthrobacter sp. J47]MEE2527646.1 YihY/virulence factor BrkB family protein [Pseudarthrobacter sp. J75]MEE2570878.1 YihY/virulence factor BrkB family protein [Pseudarthrobacter sp. J64]
MDWGRARRSRAGFGGEALAFFQWLLASLNAFRPMRAWQHYTRQHGPLMSAGIGFTMFFSITGLLTTGFSIAGLLLRDQPALLDRVVASVSESAPGLLKVNGGEGLVDPQDLLNPTGLGWTAVIAAVVTVITSLGWLNGLREGLRGVQQLPPLQVNPVVLKLRDAGTLVLLGVALVVSSGASLIFGTAAGWVTDFLALDDAVAGPLTTSIKIGVPLVLSWVTALIMFRLAAGLKLSRRALLEGTILAAVGTSVLQIFSTELLAGAGRNPLLAPFAIIIGLLIWFNLISQVYLVAGSWAAIREGDLKSAPDASAPAWGARQVQPGRVPRKPARVSARRRGTGLPRQQ